jgi:hypothetical protein
MLEMRPMVLLEWADYILECGEMHNDDRMVKTVKIMG